MVLLTCPCVCQNPLHYKFINFILRCWQGSKGDDKRPPSRTVPTPSGRQPGCPAPGRTRQGLRVQPDGPSLGRSVNGKGVLNGTNGGREQALAGSQAAEDKRRNASEIAAAPRPHAKYQRAMPVPCPPRSPGAVAEGSASTQ